MNEIKCGKCGAQCVSGTSFCRQCGAPIDSASAQVSSGLAEEPSEQATALLDQAVHVATQRLESRETGPEHGRLPQPAEVATEPNPSRRGIIMGALVIVVIGIICAAALVGIRARSHATANLQYPGSRTVLDMTGEGGGRALQLETSDSFSNVEAWYQKELKPEKTIRLTATSVVLKNDKTTATIASEGAKTNILIKTAR